MFAKSCPSAYISMHTNRVCYTFANYVFVNSLMSRYACTCVDELNRCGPDNGMTPVRRQAIVWCNAGLLSVVRIDVDIGMCMRHWIKQLWLKWWLDACSAPSHCLIRCWLIIRRTNPAQIWSKMHNLPYKNMKMKIPPYVNWLSFCLGLSVLMQMP